MKCYNKSIYNKLYYKRDNANILVVFLLSNFVSFYYYRLFFILIIFTFIKIFISERCCG